MQEKIKYTFLGAGDAALSMFIEIIASNHGEKFTVQVIKNFDVENKYPYMVPTIENSIIYHDDWKRDPKEQLVIGVNKPITKNKVYHFFKDQYGIEFDDFTSLRHNGSIIASTVKLMPGTVINPGVTLAPFAHIGNLVTINRNASIGHHTNIDDFSTIHPGVNIAGHCKISSSVTIGIGASICDGVCIGENSIIGAGSVVTKDIPANVVAFGSPAKPIRSLIKDISI